MAEDVALPAGFVLDETSALPDGFVVDAPMPANSALATGVKGFAQQLTGNWADEIDAKLTSMGLNPFSPQVPYEEKLTYNRAQDFVDAKTNPLSDASGRVGGGIAQIIAARGLLAPLAGASVVNNPLTRRALALVAPKSTFMKSVVGAATGAAGGAGYGAANEYGTGETPEGRVEAAKEGARSGAMFGGAFGAAVPVAQAGVKALTQPMKKDFAPSLLGQGTDSVDDVGKFAKVQNKLGAKYSELTSAEKSAWDKVRAQSSGKGLGGSNLKSLQDKVLSAQSTLTDNDAAGVVDRILGRWGKFAADDIAVPAEELIANRSTLSKASVKNAGLRPVVDAIDEQLQTMGVKGIKEAVSLSKERFQKFDDVKPIADALDTYATAADFGKAVFGSGSVANATKAAQRIKEIMRAAGESHKEVKEALDQAVVHRILQTSSNGGEETIWLNKASREINNLRQKNPEMWGMLSKETQEGLSKLRDAMLKADKAGGLQMASQGVLWALNKAMAPLGAKQTVRFPTPTALQSTVTLDTVKKLMKLRPDEGSSFLQKILMGVKDE